MAIATEAPLTKTKNPMLATALALFDTAFERLELDEGVASIIRQTELELTVRSIVGDDGHAQGCRIQIPSARAASGIVAPMAADEGSRAVTLKSAEGRPSAAGGTPIRLSFRCTNWNASPAVLPR
jgi:hypothetical protein